ncbi:MAG: hypothetical protein Q4D10_07930, partial [Bacteroidales bacterium]|nr:hypothetical protein [Bacteroidales bacterium]
MRIETIKYYIQSANINFLYGSGLSRPFLAVLGNIEKWLTELHEERQKNGKKVKYDIVEASILKQYFESVMLPNINPSGPDYEITRAEYQRFLQTWNELINKRNNRLVGKQVNLFTTNVDLLMERAALNFGVELNDGFQGSIEQVYDAGNFQKTVSKTSLHFQNVSDIPVLNLIKIHGSINWREENDSIKNDIGLPTVNAVKAALDTIDAANFISTTKKDTEGNFVEKTLVEMVSEAEGKQLANSDVFKTFFEEYHKLIMINPTKRKFKESVIDHHFYELMRQYSNNLEKENTILFSAGFSFADEHIADITRRAANTNPTLHIVIFAFSDDDGDTIKANLKLTDVCLNNNIVII